MYNIISGICMVAVLAFSPNLAAREASLSDEAINNYIQSLREMESLSARINSTDTEGASEMAQLWMEGDTQAITRYLQSKDYSAELSQAVKESGFDNLEEWVKTAQRVTQAFMAVDLKNTGTSTAQQMEESLVQVRESASLSQEQKDAMLQQLQASKTHLERIEKVSEADRQAIQPYMDELRELFQPPAQ